jgi:hypothetical protein
MDLMELTGILVLSSLKTCLMTLVSVLSRSLDEFAQDEM